MLRPQWYGRQADHRVEGVGESQDPGGERNLVAAEAIGIAQAVPSFMVRANDLGDGGWDIVCDEPILAMLGMGFHHLVFLRGQRSWTPEQSRRNEELPTSWSVAAVVRSVLFRCAGPCVRRFRRPVPLCAIGVDGAPLQLSGSPEEVRIAFVTRQSSSRGS